MKIRLILDLGGGGEGVIGQLKGTQVIAIDQSRRELEEAPRGPLKIVMDALDLQFLDNSFETATAFFSLMYIPGPDQERVLKEAYRVLRPSGQFLIWDRELPARKDEQEEAVAFYLKAVLPDREIETGYGTRWPEKEKDLSHYRKIAEEAGFIIQDQQRFGDLFFLTLRKPGSEKEI